MPKEKMIPISKLEKTMKEWNDKKFVGIVEAMCNLYGRIDKLINDAEQ